MSCFAVTRLAIFKWISTVFALGAASENLMAWYQVATASAVLGRPLALSHSLTSWVARASLYPIRTRKCSKALMFSSSCLFFPDIIILGKVDEIHSNGARCLVKIPAPSSSQWHGHAPEAKPSAKPSDCTPRSSLHLERTTGSLCGPLWRCHSLLASTGRPSRLASP